MILLDIINKRIITDSSGRIYSLIDIVNDYAPSISTETYVTLADGTVVKSASFTAAVSPNGSATNVNFEWGLTSSYGNSQSVDTIQPEEGTTVCETIITGLTPGYYHYRFVATNSTGTTNGDDQTFTLYPGVGQTPIDYSTALNSAISIMTGTTYYIDPSAVTNGNGLSESTPFNTWVSAGTLGGYNRYLQKRGTTYQAATGTFRGFNGPCYLGVYGTGIDKAYIVAGTNAGSDFVSSSYRLIIQDYDIMGYRSAGIGTELGRGIRLSSTLSGITMDHWVYNCNIHRFRYGIDSYFSGGFFYGMKILFCNIYEIQLDGIYPTSVTDMEIAYNYIYETNNAWFIDEDDGFSSGDGIQIGFGNSSYPDIHLYANIHHNTIDRTTTRNKFCILWNEQENGDTVDFYNNHLLCADYDTDPSHPVSSIYSSDTFGIDGDICKANIYNNVFEGGNYGVRNYTRSGTTIHHNIFIGQYIAIASGGGINIDVFNNVFKNYTSVAIGMGSNPRLTSKNNVFSTTTLTAYAYASISGLASSDYNNFYNTRINSSAYGLAEWQSEQVYDDHSNDTDTMFKNESILDFRFTTGSSLLDTGTDVGLDYDIRGVSIPRGSGYDIGVYELASGDL